MIHADGIDLVIMVRFGMAGSQGAKKGTVFSGRSVYLNREARPVFSGSARGGLACFAYNDTTIPSTQQPSSIIRLPNPLY